MVIVMVIVCFIYRPPIQGDTFNLWMMRFVHFGAQIGLKRIPCLNLNWIQTYHSRHTRTKCFFILDGNQRFFAWKNYIDRVYTKDFEHHVFVNSIILAPVPDDIPSLLTAMHDINNDCFYLLFFSFISSLYFVF